jgi:hypothetical protein
MANRAETTNDLAAQFQDAWQTFRQLVTAAENRLDERTEAGWTVKEMLGHMGFWQEAIEGVIVGMFRRRSLGDGWRFGSGYDPSTENEWPRADVHNAREAAWAREHSTHAVLERLDRSHDRALDVLNGLSPDEVADDRYRSYVAEKVQHYQEHGEEVEAIAGR